MAHLETACRGVVETACRGVKKRESNKDELPNRAAILMKRRDGLRTAWLILCRRHDGN